MVRCFSVLLVILGAAISCTPDSELEDIRAVEAYQSTETQGPQSRAVDMAGPVRLHKAWASYNAGHGQEQYFRRYSVIVQNSNYEKKISIHHEKENGQWRDIPLRFRRSLPNNEELWEGQVVVPGAYLSDEYAVKFEVNGQVHWDNNHGKNYHVNRMDGTYLSPSIPVSLDEYFSKHTGRYFNINVDVRNLGYEKQVEVHYTTDGWKTTAVKFLEYTKYFRVGYAQYLISPNKNGIEKWEAPIFVDETINVLEFVIRYEVDGQEYWDNNFGKNYKLRK